MTLPSAIWPAGEALRVMSVATLVNTTGNGAFFTVSALYFTRIVGIRPAHLGLALTIGGLAGLLATVPIGHLADRCGPREVLRILLVLLAVLTAGYLLVDDTWYQGFASTGFAASTMLAPVLLTLLCIEWGRPGWLLLTLLFVATTAAMPAVSRWALRTRAQFGVLTHSG